MVDFAGVGALVGLAGSVTTITAHALGLPAYDPERIHLTRAAGPTRCCAACESLLHMTRDERAALGFMHPGRVDVIGAGAPGLARGGPPAGRAAASHRVVTSEHDILDGIALSDALDSAVARAAGRSRPAHTVDTTMSVASVGSRPRGGGCATRRPARTRR